MDNSINDFSLLNSKENSENSSPVSNYFSDKPIKKSNFGLNEDKRISKFEKYQEEKTYHDEKINENQIIHHKSKFSEDFYFLVNDNNENLKKSNEKKTQQENRSNFNVFVSKSDNLDKRKENFNEKLNLYEKLEFKKITSEEGYIENELFPKKENFGLFIKNLENDIIEKDKEKEVKKNDNFEKEDNNKKICEKNFEKENLKEFLNEDLKKTKFKRKEF